jgi:hypothetical protein
VRRFALDVNGVELRAGSFQFILISHGQRDTGEITSQAQWLGSLVTLS